MAYFCVTFLNKPCSFAPQTYECSYELTYIEAHFATLYKMSPSGNNMQHKPYQYISTSIYHLQVSNSITYENISQTLSDSD